MAQETAPISAALGRALHKDLQIRRVKLMLDRLELESNHLRILLVDEEYLTYNQVVRGRDQSL